MSYFEEFIDCKLISPPSCIPENLVYETLVGSHGFSTNIEDSDIDLYGVFIPTREMAFPYEDRKYIVDFGKQPEKCLQYNPGGKNDKIVYNGQKYEITVYNIIRYFDLCMECNPNIIESLYADTSSVVLQVGAGTLMRQNRSLFLHKGFYHKFIKVAESHLSKVENNKKTGVRQPLHEAYGFDTKSAYNTIRYIYEAEQILKDCDLRLKDNAEFLKSIRRGEVPLEDIRKLFQEKKEDCEKLFLNSKLQSHPNEELIKELLLKCLEIHWGKV